MGVAYIKYLYQSFKEAKKEVTLKDAWRPQIMTNINF